MGSVLWLTHAAFPGRASLLWAIAAGSIGGISLAMFYRALASGKMGLTAPVAAVLGAGIPTIVTAFAQGFPGYRHVAGFVLAGIGVWLISRTEGDAGHPEGLGLAVLAGIGFAGFYLCVNQAGNASALWIAWSSRVRVAGGDERVCRARRRQVRALATPVARHCRLHRMPRRHRQRIVYSRRPIRTSRHCRCAQFSLSCRNRGTGANLPSRTLQPRAHHRHARGAGRGTHDCGMRQVDSG